jgi:hypothetical protein
MAQSVIPIAYRHHSPPSWDLAPTLSLATRLSTTSAWFWIQGVTVSAPRRCSTVQSVHRFVLNIILTLYRQAIPTAAATAYIHFDNIMIPVDHLLGEGDRGFRINKSNSNHERWATTAAVVR